MKTFISIALAILSLSVLAQTPGGINYQATARDAAGELIKNKAISVKAVILSGSSGSNVEYTETHAVTTNDYGHFTLIVGEGSTSDNFGAITWGTKKHHLKIELDNGSGFVNMGTMAFQSVPYALSAKNVENMPTLALTDISDVNTSGASNGQVLGWDGTSWKPVNAATGGTTYTGGTGITITGSTIAANTGIASWNANQIQGRTLANTAPSSGQVLGWNGSMWAPTSVSAGNTYTAGTGLTLTGSSFSANTTTALWNASQLQGRSVSGTMPAANQVLKWNGTSWAPAADNGGSYSAGTGISLTGTSFSANTTTALWNASQLQGRNVSSSSPSSNQVLKWNGSAWAPSADNNTSYTAGSGLSLSGSSFSANNTVALWNASQLQGRTLNNTAPTANQILGWNGTAWAPKTISEGHWDTAGTTIIHTNKDVGIGTSTPFSRFDVVDTITATANGNSYVSSYIQSRGSTGNQSTSNALWSQVDGQGGYLNVGIRGRAIGNSNATYVGTGAYGGYFIADCALGQNNFGVRSEAGNNNTGTVRNYGVYSTSRGDGTFNMGVFALANKSTTGGAKTNYGIYAQADSGTTNYAAYFAGNVSYTGTLANASDARLKSNVTEFENAISKVESLNVKTYLYKQDGKYGKMNLPKGTQFGFIAQELEQVLPELVENQVHAFNAEDNKQEAEAFEYKAVNYIGMIPVLTKAIQEQQDYIKALEARIEALENAK